MKRVALAGVVAGLLAPTIALADSPSGTCPPGSSGPNYCQRIPTKLVASPVIPSGISATLTRTDTGAPLSGQTLTFTAGGTVLCTAVTDGSGTASCNSLLAVVLALLNLGYDVSYAGNATYLPSTAHGAALQLGWLIIGAQDAKAQHLHGARADARLKRELRAIGRKRLERELRILRKRHVHVH